MDEQALIERVARALCKVRDVDPDDVNPLGAPNVPNWCHFIQSARAHIAAHDAIRSVYRSEPD